MQITLAGLFQSPVQLGTVHCPQLPLPSPIGEGEAREQRSATTRSRRRAHHRPFSSPSSLPALRGGRFDLTHRRRARWTAPWTECGGRCLRSAAALEKEKAWRGDEVRKARLPGKQATSSALSLTHRLPVSAVISNSAHDHHLRHIVPQLVSH